MYEDPELVAMAKVLEALKNLNNPERRRIMDWITSKFSLVETVIQPPKPEIEREVIPASKEETPVEKISQDEEQTPGEINETTSEEEDDDNTEDTISTKGFGLKRYKTIETLFLSADIKTVTSKILLVAAYLQEKKNFKEFSSFDVNSRLKKMGYGVNNISASLNSMIAKKNPLIVQTSKEGDSKQGKRKFMVTEEGLKVAKSYLRGKGKGE